MKNCAMLPPAAPSDRASRLGKELSAPWKSGLSSSYKSGSSSAYSSRDDVSTPRYTSLATPSTYRPSFSGGTYRIKRDPPATPVTTYVSRYSTANSTRPVDKDNSNDSLSKSSQLKRYISTSSNLGKYSREPSPAAIEITNRIKSREPSPVARALRGKSRDPSPVIDTNCKIGYGGASSYRMSTPRSVSTGYTSRYGSNAASTRTSSNNNMLDKSISYLSVSDFRARSISRVRENITRKSNEKEIEPTPDEKIIEADIPTRENVNPTEVVKEESNSDSSVEETFVSVSVVTRATSPTPPGSATTVHRTRRIDIAKTIEKTIQRSTKKKKMLEKEIQSDRLDDSTRYSRFGMSTRVSSYSPHNESRYSSSNLRYSASPLSTSSKSSANEPKKEDTSSSSSNSKSCRSAANKSKLSPPKVMRINSRQSSVENLSTSNANKPPAPPKSESPTKSNSSGSHSVAKWPNKDFRKSALNVGPTDRPRKSRTPSSGTDSDAVQQATNDTHSAHDRSPSAGSEASNASAGSGRRATGSENKLRQRSHAKSNCNGTPPLSRHNSSSNLKNNSHKSCTPSTSSSATTSASSSSGTESSSDNKKTSKKNAKKKTQNPHNKGLNEKTASKTNNNYPASAGDFNDLSPKRSTAAEAENSTESQPPATNTDSRTASSIEHRTAAEQAQTILAESSQSHSKSKSPYSPQEKATHRLQKLSSVSNFFAARQNDTNSEPIFLESSESSGNLDTDPLISNSLTEDFKTNTSSANKATATITSVDPASSTAAVSSLTTSKRHFYTNLDSSENTSALNPPCTAQTDSITKHSETGSLPSTKSSSSNFPNETAATATSTAITSEPYTESPTTYTTMTAATTTTSTEQEEPSWWQDTSCQINTASALDFNHKDEMRFKLRHIDSGETAWWLRNDEDDTLADDNLRTLNHEEDESEATDAVPSLSNTHSGSDAAPPHEEHNWWTTNEIDYEEQHNENDQNETNYGRSRSVDNHYKMNGNGIGNGNVGNDSWQVKNLPKSNCTPEKQWWIESNGSGGGSGGYNNHRSDNSNSSGKKQNGAIQLKICRVESGDRPWWLDQEENTNNNNNYNNNNNNATVEATIKLPIKKKDNPERSSSSSSKNLSDGKHWWMSGPTKKHFNIQRVESGEKAWWQQQADDQIEHKPAVVMTMPPLPQQQQYHQTTNISIKRNISGERDWWLQDEDGGGSGEQLKPKMVETLQNGHYAAMQALQIKESDDEDDNGSGNGNEEVQNIINYNAHSNGGAEAFGNRSDSHTELSNSFNFDYSERPPPLGQCASPIALEEPQQQQPRHSKSPYDNIPMSKVQSNPNHNHQYIHHHQQEQMIQQPSMQQQQQSYDYSSNNSNSNAAYQPTCYQHSNNNNSNNSNHFKNKNKQSRSGKLFISRHQNIDELLGGSCRPLSPLFLDSSFSTHSLTSRNMFLEEITPDQVRIHDSTPQMPVIQRMERDECDNYPITPAAVNIASRFNQNPSIDDAAIQVYKDGDYGAYLDLESSLAEQAEEIEGLNSSRKNSLVVRTQLSVRVHAIIEKLLSAEGSDLRRALFSLKQVFQEDKDLVHAFVALGGLNCLVRVGNGADQNYQNYILRALGQVMLYVDGMNGVMKHEPTMQWLYSLIASNYRSVVKTALKLLLVFVEYAESNCYTLVNAIHAVDKSQGTLPWSNIMRLLKDYDNADAELVIYATSLINKTLAGLNDQDGFYDESDLLEQQGMKSVIQRYMSKQGTDLDLLDQLQLYEAVLKFEDGESDGMRLPDNSVRKTQRYRPGTDSAERRKSRRHSTGTSPSVINKVITSPKRGTPIHGVLDEDSSGSTNSTEFSSGVFQEKKIREGIGADVTPGLRRRRERAERHKSFLKEQQEAVANGIFAALDRREEMGQIVTAIPATVKNGDSPPESLILTNETTNISSTNINNHNNNHTSSINYPSITANAITTTTNNNSNIINATSNNSSSNSINNNNSSSNNLMSPTKQLLSSNTISIINNSFDKSHISNKLQATPEFLTKKNLLLERNAASTVINGIMKNIQRGNSTGNNSSGNSDNDNNNTNAYKKYENDANRLNSYFSQMSSNNNNNNNSSNSTPVTPTTTPPPKNPQQQQTMHTAQSVLSAVLSPKKTLKGFDFTQTSTPNTITNNKASAMNVNDDDNDETAQENAAAAATLEILTLTTTTPSPMTTTATTPTTTTPLSTPNTPDAVEPQFNKTTTTTTTMTMKNSRIVTPPPPPPPPLPPDHFLKGFRNIAADSAYAPQTVSNQQNTITNTIDSTGNIVPSSYDLLNDDDENLLQITESDNEDKQLLLQLKRDHTVKDLTQKLSNMPTSPTQEDKLQNRFVGDMSGLISKAKEGLAKSKSKGEMSRSSSVDQEIKKPEPKKSENELHWEELTRNMLRPLNLCDLDFTDLNSDDEKDVLAPRSLGGGIPPPPPPFGGIPPPMMPPPYIVCPPPMMNNMGHLIPPPMLSYSGYGNSSLTNSVNSSMNGSINGDTNTIKKNKKTVKLFWKEVREDMIPVVIGKTIWDELPASNVDTQKLEHLFESRAKDLMIKKQQELNKSKEVIVLDHKRSNAINIAMTKLPPPRAIKAAILKMDATVVTREGIDKLFNMLPTDEERSKIQEAQMANPELPLGSAEQFLLTLASISELAARLKLWAFRLDFDNSEKEIAEPLMDLKLGIQILRNNRTFKCILSTLLSVGIFLNGAPVKGFQIEYLAKVPEVKDTVHKHSLLHHLCHMVMESCTDTTDLYSEIGPITRASKADFADLAHNLNQLETECKSSWDRLKLIAKHDCPPQLKQKLVDFLADCAERIIILQIVHRRVINRYRKFLLWLGIPQHSVAESKPNEFCRILSEFALEYRTTRERVQQQIEKKANHRERNKTRGKMIIDIAKFKTKEDRADAELKELLGTPNSDIVDGTLTWRRRRAENLRSPITRQSEENFTDGDDEILESLVKTATKAPGTRTTPRERKRTRHADRKSLRRTLKNGLTEEEKQHVAALIKTY